MAVDTVPEGFPAIPILATENGDEIHAFLEQTFEATLLDRHDAPDGGPVSRGMETVSNVAAPLPIRDVR